MKLFSTSILIFLFSFTSFAQSWIRINQLGYQEKTIKVAVFVSKENVKVNKFELKDAVTNKKVFSSNTVEFFGKYGPFTNTYRLNFSDYIKPGKYYVEANGIKSPAFVINDNVYDGTADFLLKYMRQQQCGYNPLIKDSCHTHDGFIIYHPTKTNEHIDVTGGWHDASDYLQYITTSANTVFQMLFAYQQNPTAFGDEYDKNGNPGKNGVPDILDQAKWGLDWLDKMNPEKDVMFNQIADDRDHRGFRSPAEDTVNYGKGLERPVYYCTGEPQGLMGYMNRTTGIASTAAKYSSAFSLGAVLLEKYYPEFAKKIKQKSIDAFYWGKKNPGVCQTASCVSPYFYEEDNWVEDMELAAIQLKINENKNDYLKEALYYGEVEPVTPWMGADSARHYQWYPFVNLGHYYLAKENDSKVSKQYTGYMWQGLNRIKKRGADNPFLFGVPFIWCSNNLVAAALTQADLYTKLIGDNTFSEMEAALRDWLFGCNPWGTSMIVGLPESGDYPQDIHSALHVHYNYKIDGGLVDGPVYTTIFNSLRGLQIVNGDEYKDFQSDIVVYHDDYGDYSTNEPTMDGTASLTYYFSSLQAGVKKK
ncbi:MAG TPA: glycoside hydrolase family 9 protein [Ignavibacteriaceae bacterium]|nr:glycoside hydrolase family 9 protein [Ignavibacteriaceae bacterium]